MINESPNTLYLVSVEGHPAIVRKGHRLLNSYPVINTFPSTASAMGYTKQDFLQMISDHSGVSQMGTEATPQEDVDITESFGDIPDQATEDPDPEPKEGVPVKKLDALPDFSGIGDKKAIRMWVLNGDTDFHAWAREGNYIPDGRSGEARLIKETKEAWARFRASDKE